MRRMVAAALVAVALLAMLAAPAMAGKPTKETFIDESSFEIVCDGFVLQETYRDRVIVMTWSDRNGNPVRIQAHHSWTGTISGPGGILQLNDPGHWTDFITIGPNGDTVRQVGVIYTYIVKGHGLLAHDVGQITFHPDGSVTTKGPHDVFEQGIESIVCPLFID